MLCYAGLKNKSHYILRSKICSYIYNHNPSITDISFSRNPFITFPIIGICFFIITFTLVHKKNDVLTEKENIIHFFAQQDTYLVLIDYYNW